jgi:hypothetical protein
MNRGASKQIRPVATGSPEQSRRDDKQYLSSLRDFHGWGHAPRLGSWLFVPSPGTGFPSRRRLCALPVGMNFWFRYFGLMQIRFPGSFRSSCADKPEAPGE